MRERTWFGNSFVASELNLDMNWDDASSALKNPEMVCSISQFQNLIYFSIIIFLSWTRHMINSEMLFVRLITPLPFGDTFLDADQTKATDYISRIHYK
jgi:hypothetical protein